MNILSIVLSLISAYVLFVSVSYLLARVLFPKVELTDDQGKSRVARARQRRLTRAAR
jgi:hypothetical protein